MILAPQMSSSGIGGNVIFSREGDDLVLGDYNNPSQPSAIIKDQYNTTTGSKIEEIRLSDGTLVTLPNAIVNDYSYDGGTQFYEVDPSNLSLEVITLQNHSINDIESISRYSDDLHVKFNNEDSLILIGQNSNQFISGIADQEGNVFDKFGYDRWFFHDATPNYGVVLNDYIRGSDVPSTLLGQGGDDYLDGQGGDDNLYGGDGSDVLHGGAGMDKLVGGQGADILKGGDGDDSLYGGSDINSYNPIGNDILDGGLGNDFYKGGLGKDTFVITREANAVDTIIDYYGKNGGETIDLSDFSDLNITFDQLKAGFSYEGTYLDIALPDNQKIRIYSTDSYSLITENNFVGLKVNHAPEAQNDVFSGDENQDIFGNFLIDNGNGADFDNDVEDILSVVSGNYETTNGSIIVQDNGDFVYTPNTDFYGEDTFSYTLQDNGGKTSTGFVTFNVEEFSLAEDDYVVTSEDTSLIVNVLANDLITNVSNVSFEQPQNAIVSLNEDNTFNYTPNTDVNGQDSFVYSVFDDQGEVHRATVFVNITPVNDAPVAYNDAFTILENGMLNGNVLVDNTLGADTDAENDPLSVIASDFTTSFGGVVTLLSNGDFTYTSMPNFIGVDTFNYDVMDDSGAMSTGVVRIAVEPLIDDIHGTSSDDTLLGYNHDDIGDDTIYGYEGNDTIIAKGGNDTLVGGTGDDVLHGGLGSDTYIINDRYDGHDVIFESDDNSIDTIKWGHDWIDYQKSGMDLIIGYPDADNAPSVTVKNYFDTTVNNRIERLEMPDGTMYNLPNLHVNNFTYSGGISFFEPTEGMDKETIELDGYNIEDIISVQKTLEGSVKINFGTDNYIVINEISSNIDFVEKLTDIHGNEFSGINYDTWSLNTPNNFYGSAGKNYVTGGDNDNTLSGGADNDYLHGNAGNDHLYGWDSNDKIFGGDGNDKLYGDRGTSESVGDGVDVLNGGSGDDEIYGNGGNDTLIDGLGNDYLMGGNGSDLYYITQESGAEDTIYLMDISGNNDNIDLSSFFTHNLTFEDIVSNFTYDSNWLHINLPNNQKIKVYSTEDYTLLSEGHFLGLNTKPIANADSFTATENTVFNGNVLNDNGSGTDHDEDGDVISVVSMTALTSQGVAVDVMSDGSFSYTPPMNFIGTDSFEYNLIDSRGAQSVGIVSIVVSEFPDIHGSNSDEVLYGFLNTEIGDDAIYAYEGNDIIYARGGDDVVYGGLGGDELYGENGNDILHGGDDNDYINGGDGNDEIHGDLGNDTLYGRNGNDRIYGGAGVDVFWGEAGDDFLYGGDGDDVKLDGGLGNDTIYGDAGNDTIYGREGNDTLYGGTGDDTIYSGEGQNTIYGDEGADFIIAGSQQDEIHGGDGHDRIYAVEGDDLIHGDAGNDEIYGGTGNDEIYGGNDIDVIYGDDGDDVIHGGDGGDIKLEGGDGNDTIYGDGGNDTIYGRLGNDTLNGGSGDDVIYAHEGNDILYGGDGHDLMWGYDGDDTLNGGLGYDRLYGNAGADTFVFTDYSQYTSIYDRVHDFNVADGDILDISDLISSYDPLTENITDYVSVSHNTARSYIYIDNDGAGTNASMEYSIRMDGVFWDNADMATLITNGTVIV